MIVVSKIQSHSQDKVPVFGKRYTCLKRDFLKLVSQIMK